MMLPRPCALSKGTVKLSFPRAEQGTMLSSVPGRTVAQPEAGITVERKLFLHYKLLYQGSKLNDRHPTLT